jgi:hypothetical protein
LPWETVVGLLLKFLVFWTFQAIFFFVIVLLAIRDRSIVLRGLVDEAGRLLHPKELKRTTSYWMLVPFVNLFSLMSSPGGYGKSRRKQLDLIELAFLKYHQRDGARTQASQEREHALRRRVQQANEQGVFIGIAEELGISASARKALVGSAGEGARDHESLDLTGAFVNL